MATMSSTAVNKKGGFACEFIKTPPEAIQSKCFVCLEILREPYQAPCCGNSFCRVCVEKIKADNKPCPTCKEENFVTFYNKGLEIALSKFQVYCSNKQEGCEWKGELGQLDNHLNLSPQPDKQLEGCDYSEIECIYCSELIKRPTIGVHQTEHCPKRPFNCVKCHNYKSYYEDVVNNHWPVCGYQTVRCPNECGTTLKRQALENHITGSCAKAVIDCDFHHFGCYVRLPRKDMPAHLTADLITHMSLQAVSFKQLQEKVNKLESENETLKRQLEANESQLQLTQAQIETTQQAAEKVPLMEQQLATQQKMSEADNRTLQQIMNRLKLQVYNTANITMSSYQQLKRDNISWFSPGFYTHPQGYKFCLRVDANGLRHGQNTHVSIHFYLMKGEFDHLLNWPFKGDIAIKILGRDGRSYEKTIQFTTTTAERVNSRVMEGERNLNGRGLSAFISHSTLQAHYVLNDSLYFQIKYKDVTKVRSYIASAINSLTQ